MKGTAWVKTPAYPGGFIKIIRLIKFRIIIESLSNYSADNFFINFKLFSFGAQIPNFGPPLGRNFCSTYQATQRFP